MPQTIDEVLAAAMALPESERAELVEILTATIPEPPTTLHPSWGPELRRRVAAIDSGEVKPVPLEDVRRQIQAQLDEDMV